MTDDIHKALANTLAARLRNHVQEMAAHGFVGGAAAWNRVSNDLLAAADQLGTLPPPEGPVVERMARAMREAAIAAGTGEPAWSDCVTDDEWGAAAQAALAVVLAGIEAERLDYASDDPDSEAMRVIDDIVKRLTGDRADD